VTAPPSRPAPPVVIVGAGPTGISAAILLAAYGVPTLILERWDGIFPQPRAVHLDDEIYRILGRMGVAEPFSHISRSALGLQVVDDDHNVLARFERSPHDGRHGYPQASLFDQPELEAILRQRLQDLDRTVLRGGVEVTAVRTANDESVVLDVVDRHTQETDQITARFVLACDGANSGLRAAIGARMQDLHFEQEWLVVDIETGEELGQWEGVHQVAARERAATYMRIGTRRHRWEFQLRPGEQAADFATIEALHPLIQPWTGDTPPDALEVVKSASYVFKAQVADRWRSGSLFLLGDAAHLTPPFIGQGMGAGVRDAHNLAWKLAGVLDGSLDDAVLDTYQAERKPHTRTMILSAVLIGLAMTGGGVTGDALRRTALPYARRIPGLRKRALSSETPRLSHSSLVKTRLAPYALEGRQCPNAVVEGDRRYDDVVGSGFVLVTRGPPDARGERMARASGVTLLAVEPGSALGRWLDGGRAEAALVRPDNTVAVTGRDIPQLLSFISQLRPRPI
jgi:3-(3-hydroxy-phenyl)propionate hydroxylase